MFNSLVLSNNVANGSKHQILAYNKTLNTNLSEHFINLKKDKLQLGYYLAGLIESDGSIIVPSYHSSAYTPKISIVFNSKDKPLALHLINTLGYGSIQKSNSDSAIYLVIRNKKGIIDLISLVNGKFRTPKISSLYKLIDWFKDSRTYSFLIDNKLEKLPLDKSNLESNAWLSGFSEGDKDIMQDIATLFLGVSSEIYLSKFDSALRRKTRIFMVSELALSFGVSVIPSGLAA